MLELWTESVLTLWFRKHIQWSPELSLVIQYPNFPFESKSYLTCPAGFSSICDYFFRLKYRIQSHLFTSHWITKVAIVLYFVLQKILTHVKQVIQSKWPCTSSHKLNRTKIFTLAFKLDATYCHIYCRHSLCFSYNLPPFEPFVLGSYIYAICQLVTEEFNSEVSRTKVQSLWVFEHH